MLGETEEAVADAAIGMFAEDGSIRIIDENLTDDDWSIAWRPGQNGGYTADFMSGYQRWKHFRKSPLRACVRVWRRR